MLFPRRSRFSAWKTDSRLLIGTGLAALFVVRNAQSYQGSSERFVSRNAAA
jgi:hypothetical protein